MKPMKLAVVGGGPSGFYVASRLLSLLPKEHPRHSQLRIHMYDRLWAPHGLVRYGVAPDHPEVKNCTNKFDEAASDPRFKFFGHVSVGHPSKSEWKSGETLPLSSLFKNYTHLLFSTGCTEPKVHPTLSGSPFVIPALNFVHWYTQHPSNRDWIPPIRDATHVSLIGNGNVALDVARMLLTSASVLAKYDVPEPVLQILENSSVKHVSIIGRRGPLEAAFTNKELRELINLPEASMQPIEPGVLEFPSETKLTRQQTRMLQLLKQGSKQPFGSTPKTWSLEFYRSPGGIDPPSSSSSQAQLHLSHTKVDPDTGRAVSSGESSVLPTSLVVPSLGFKVPAEEEALEPYYDPALSHLRTMSGRIVSSQGNVVKNVYASGWAATGAKGVLAATMVDAYAVADVMLTDWLGSRKEGNADAGAEVQTMPLSPQSASVSDLVTEKVMADLGEEGQLDDVPSEVVDGLKDKRITTYEDWKSIDEEEIRRGQEIGKERERMGEWDEVRDFLDSTYDSS